MNYKLIDHHGQGFIVMGAHDYDRWRDHLGRRFDGTADAGPQHLHVRVGGHDRSFDSVEAYLSEFTVREIGEADAKVLARLFAVDQSAHHAWYGQHELFQPFAGK